MNRRGEEITGALVKLICFKAFIRHSVLRVILIGAEAENRRYRQLPVLFR